MATNSYVFVELTSGSLPPKTASKKQKTKAIPDLQQGIKVKTKKLVTRSSSISKEAARKGIKSNSFLKEQIGRQSAQSYSEELKVFLEQNKKYPRLAQRLKQSGTVTLRVKIYADGRFGNVEILNESPFDSLNQAAVDLLKSLGRFKPLPQSFESEENFVIPIAYRMDASRI